MVCVSFYNKHIATVIDTSIGILQKPLSLSKATKVSKATAQYKQALAKKKTGKAGLSVREIYEQGGKPFVDAVRKYGRTERNLPLKLPPWYLEHLELIGDLRINEVYVSGIAQAGKTLSANLLLCFCLAYCRLNAVTFFDQQRTRDRNVPLQFKPLIEQWVKQMGIENEVVSSSNTIYKIGNASGVFSYANTSRATTSRQGLAAVGSAAAGVTGDILFTDERSQFLPGTSDTLPRRLDASQLPSKPQRHFGTKGAGAGVERYIAQCDYQFFPHYKCPHCGLEQALDPLGCLIKPVTRTIRGKPVLCFFSESGRPQDWFHHDPNDAVRTAYFGCRKCGTEIPEQSRAEAYLVCKKTGMRFRDFIKLLESEEKRRYRVSTEISPLCRIVDFNLAEDIINNGLTSGNISDWHQQQLGIQSQLAANSLTVEDIRRSILAPRHERRADVVVAGIDQGRSQHWLMVVKISMPLNWKEMPVEQIIENSIQTILYGGAIVKSEILDKLKEYNVDYGLIDNEPDITESSEFARVSCLEIADQRTNILDAYRKGKVSQGAIEHKAWFINNSKFLKQVINVFLLGDENGDPLVRCPESWQTWLNNPSEMSPIRHLTAPSYDPDTGLFKRGDGNVDDIFYSMMFSQAAFYIWLTEKAKNSVFAAGLGKVKHDHVPLKRDRSSMMII